MASRTSNQVDWILVICILLLLVFGLIMVNSVSIYDYLLTLNNPRDYNINTFALKQTILVILSVGLLAGASNLHYKMWKKLSIVIYVLAIFLLLLVFTPFGQTLNGAKGWLNFGAFFPSIQPLEIAKLGTILYLARWLEPKVGELQTFDAGFVPFGIIVGTVGLLLALQPDFGGILVLIPTCVVMFFVAGARIKHLAMSGLIVALVFLVAFFSFPHVRDRVYDFVDPDVDPGNKNVGWQIQQSLIAVGSGGFFGKGINKSIQKWGYLPEVQNDTIFAAIAEETGFRGSLALIGLFLCMGWRGMLIARNAPDKFAKYVAIGISFWILWQAFVNIAVVIKVLPLTGLTLPFISAGGSSLLITVLSISILINISRYTNVPHEYITNRRRVGRAHSPQPSTRKRVKKARA